MVQAYQLLVTEMYVQGWDYPLHLGVTVAGEWEDGWMKYAIGIGTLIQVQAFQKSKGRLFCSWENNGVLGKHNIYCKGTMKNESLWYVTSFCLHNQ